MMRDGTSGADFSPFFLGAVAALRLPAWIVGGSFLGVGSLARDAGHPIGAVMMATVLIWAGPAQLILYGSLISGGALLAVAVAIGLSAIRLTPMTLAILPYLRRPGQSWLFQVLMAHFVAATTWMECMRRLPDMEPEARTPFYMGFGTACMGVSLATTVIGFLLIGALPHAFAAGLLCLTPIYFTIGMTGGAVRLGDWLAIGFGLGLLPLAQAVVGPDFDILATGLLGGTVAYWIGKRGTARGRSA